MSTTRGQYAAALASGLGNASADAQRVILAWQMQEGQRPEENDPLAHLNTHNAKPPGETGDSFAYDHVDHALGDDLASMQHGHVYGSIGDAFRAGKTAPDLIATIGAAGWCGGPRNPCVAYASGIRGNYNRIADPTQYARAAAVLVATTSLSGAAGVPATGAGSTPTVPAGGGGVTITPVGFPGSGLLKDLLGVPGTVIGDTGKAVGAIGTVFAHLLDPTFWKRVGVFVLGLAVALLGLKLLAPAAADKIAGGAGDLAKGAAAAAVAF